MHRRRFRTLGKAGAFVLFLVGLAGVPDDVATIGSWVDWLENNTFDWRLMFGGVALFAVVHFSDRIESLFRGDIGLCKRADQASKDIWVFLSDRKGFDPSNEVPWKGVSRSASEEEKNRAHDNYLDRSRSYRNQTITAFDQRFGSEVEWLSSELLERGVISEDKASWFRHGATNQIGIEMIARELGAAARRMGCVG